MRLKKSVGVVGVASSSSVQSRAGATISSGALSGSKFSSHLPHQMDRTGFFPIPSAGAARFDQAVWRFTWNGNFAGATQGTLQYACEFSPTGSLPYVGPGMVQRNANFTGGTAEHLVGQCALYRCGFPPSAAGDETDKATQP